VFFIKHKATAWKRASREVFIKGWGMLEVGGWRLELEAGGWKLEVGSWKLEVGSWKLEVKCKKI
jgi:hypothetical protein